MIMVGCILHNLAMEDLDDDDDYDAYPEDVLTMAESIARVYTHDVSCEEDEATDELSELTDGEESAMYTNCNKQYRIAATDRLMEDKAHMGSGTGSELIDEVPEDWNSRRMNGLAPVWFELPTEAEEMERQLEERNTLS